MCAAIRKRWLYVKKKSENPEKVSVRQRTSSVTSNSNITPKKRSLIPAAASFGGMVFSGFTWGIPELIIFSLLVVLPLNFFYYGRPLLRMAGNFFLAFKKQKYDQSISKTEANEHERIMTQMKYEHEYRMKQLEYDRKNKEKGDSDNTPPPPANVTEETYHRYLS